LEEILFCVDTPLGNFFYLYIVMTQNHFPSLVCVVQVSIDMTFRLCTEWFIFQFKMYSLWGLEKRAMLDILKLTLSGVRRPRSRVQAYIAGINEFLATL